MTGKDEPRWVVRARSLSLLAAVVLALSACAGLTSSVQSSRSSPSPLAAVLATPSTLTSYDVNADPIVQVVKDVTPAVVTVTSETRSTAFFGGSVASKVVGTGFVVRSDGVILTNEHVVGDAADITITLPDGRTLDAWELASDQSRDLAVLKIDAEDLATVTLGDSSGLAVGEQVLAIGFALDLSGGPTVTSGIISSLQRTIQAQDPTGATRTYQDALQTDAALNAGNSGGPLVTLDGKVIGINAAGSSQAENIGFAVAIDAAKPLIEQAVGS